MAENDPRLAACYGISEAAHYLKMPVSTLRAWTVGQNYSSVDRRRVFRPIIQRADRKRNLLSFVNLVEAHVLLAICRGHKVRLPKVRDALTYLKKHLGYQGNHPLANVEFITDGQRLFVERFGQLIKASPEGQMVMKQVIETYLKRIEYDQEGMPLSLYPFSRTAESTKNVGLGEQPKVVVINPFVSFGRPVLSEVGVPTEIVNERFNAGETMVELAEDYSLEVSDIEEAIRYERTARAA